MSNQLGKAELDRELQDFAMRHPNLEGHERFVGWFVRAYCTDNDEAALNSLTGANREKGIDALLIDDANDLVTVIQGKYRQRVMESPEKASDLIEFAHLAYHLSSEDRDFRRFTEKMDDLAKRRARMARKRLLEKQYRLNMHYVTLGRCSKQAVRQARDNARAVAGATLDHPPELQVFDGNDVLAVLGDYLDGVAPPVPSLRLQSAGEVAYQHDRDSGIESWVFSMSGKEVGRLLENNGEKLFARNIRGYLGEDRKVNKAMRETIARRPESFLFLNNGITVICDAANPGQSGGAEFLEVFNPQIINGQQTTHVLREAGSQARKAKVFMRVIGVKRGRGEGWADYEKMVGSIVEATNSQNTIKASDLRSNDRLQVRLQRDLRKLNYFYIRKAGRSHEWDLASQHQLRIKKEEAARAVMACRSAATLLNEGVQALFEPPIYEEVFRLRAQQILARWWLLKTVDAHARGVGERQASKFLVMQFLWDQLGEAIEKNEDRFIAGCEAEGEVRDALDRAVRHASSGALQHYRKDRGSGDDRLEPNPFFKRRDRYEEFMRFWRSRRSSHHKNFTKAANDFRRTIRR